MHCGILDEQNLEIENSLYQVKCVLHEVSLAILLVLPSGFPSVLSLFPDYSYRSNLSDISTVLQNEDDA